MKHLSVFLLLLCACLSLSAQVTLEDVKRNPNLSANRYRAYPAEERDSLSSPPRGFKPFYVYYIGRHGSRFLERKTSYTSILKLFEQAQEDDALTDKGKDVFRRLRVIAADAAGRYGALTRTGERQLRGIAERMYRAYPEIFGKDDLEVHAISTTSKRVINTMHAYCDRMRELNPRGRIIETVDSPVYGEWGSDTPGEQTVADAGTPYGKRYREILDEYRQPARLVESLFKNPSYPESKGRSGNFVLSSLFKIASDIQDTALDFEDYNLYDIFTAEELYKLSVIDNYQTYVDYGASPETAGIKNHIIHKPMELMIERAEAAWRDGTDDAFLVFCHDGNIGPYAAALKIPWAYNDHAIEPEEVSRVYSAATVVTMGCNLQFIFYRNRKGRILVKVLLNEREAMLPIGIDGTPYNDWDAFKTFALSK